MGLKEIIEDIEKDVGQFSSQYKTIEHGHTYTIPFDLKPAEQMLAALGSVQDPKAILSTAPSALKTSDNAAIKLRGFTTNTADKTLAISGQRVDHLLQSSKIYVNTALFPEGLYQRAMQEELVSKKAELPKETNGVDWENLAVGVCHAQEVDLLVDTIMSSHKRAHVSVREGEISNDTPGLLLLSSPRLNLKSALGEHMDKGMQAHFIEGMFFNLFDAAQREGRQYIAMTAAGLGSHGGKSEMYFKALMKVAQAFPKLNIVYHPGDHEKSFKKALRAAKPENVVMATKNLIFVADRLNKTGRPCALHIPAESDVIYGLSDVGGHWKSNNSENHHHHLFSIHRKAETSQTFMGALSTAPLNSRGLNPRAYATVIERNLENPLQTTLEVGRASTSQSHTLSNETLTEPGLQIEVNEGKEPATSELVSGEGRVETLVVPSPESPRSPEANIDKAPKHREIPHPVPQDVGLSASTEVENPQPSKPVIQEQPPQQTTVSPKKDASDTLRHSGSPSRNGIFSPPSQSTQSPPKPKPVGSSLDESQLLQINEVIDRLTGEINSCWPYPNKDLKQVKVDALNELITKAETMRISDAIAAIKRKYPRVDEGSLSTRTADLLIQLEQGARSHSLDMS
ncbi:hypothetical protein BN59_02807 [Legionella massiliensis]|uniref:Uncharacterized protein n=1 Tax=Legionella massiliensis TaxID=1034943 RepID=A0A078KZT1_9GAMM|nr:hypothetical protein [Legionella massiliensis]CDZ78497.1 hypothetical protein BN59_02807 [Legionella massiliensis]CEE14235.1 hypothetical protein BN1094_02807 [Legionella massiliensis]